MRLRTTSSAIATGSIAASSRAACAPWAFGKSLPHQPRLGRMALPNGRSDRSGVNVWTTSSSWARRIYAESCDPMLAITTTFEHIGHWIRMRQSLARFSGPESSPQIRSLADFIITTSEFSFRYTQGARQRDILAQFLIEAVTLALLGAGLGVLAGIGGSMAIATVAGWPVVIDPGAVLL